jgi:aryl-alcohol dehydrogenase-like predicted oxidoreductase
MMTPHDYRAANVRAGVEQSLRLLRTDHLDLLQVHLSPSRSELEAGGTAEELQALRDAGKVRFIGMSGTLPHLPDHIAMGVLIRGAVARGTASEDKNWTVQPLITSGPPSWTAGRQPSSMSYWRTE